MGNHSSYAVQTAAMFVGAIPTVGALAVIVGAHLEKAKRRAPIVGRSLACDLAEQARRALMAPAVVAEQT